ncbi:hypothetical protein [Mycoplasma sp. 1018B]|uniref:hypothetical protein n=1 Tax=Mycoplasma sp. 1018B TaxID=2967302 RepID=UPI00211BA91D|nr:hypothetical protein [Mycoplasma sp. 1018B]UUM19083.1 hypothetical protein NPA14_01945 [Mycoplasma sp. 1018B]
MFTYLKIVKNSLKNEKLNHCYLLKSYELIDFNSAIINIINLITNINLTSLDEQLLPSNIKILNAEDKNLTKDNIKKIFETLNIISHNKKIVILKNIENASIQALNTILLTLEEPSQNVLFIITTNNIEKVLPTIKSRAIILNIRNDDFKEIAYLKLKKEKFDNIEINFILQLFSSIEQIDKYISKTNLTIVSDFFKILNSNINNIYLFLSKYNKKDLFDIAYLLIYSLRLLAFEIFVNKKSDYPEWFVKSKLNLSKNSFNFEKIFILCDSFLNETHKSTFNIFLQLENFLIELVRLWNE